MYIYVYIYIYREREIIKDTGLNMLLRGPKFEESETQLFLNQKLLEESQKDSQKGENPYP